MRQAIRMGGAYRWDQGGGIAPQSDVLAPPDPAAGGAECPSCAAASGPFVYAIGRIEPRFPSLAVEKEFVQATGRADTAGLTDREAMANILAQRQNRYLARQICWVLSIERLDTYILRPRDLADLDLLIEAARPQPSPLDVDTVIGVRGPLAPPDICNGLMVPVVTFEQIYSFDRQGLIAAIPRPEAIAEERFVSAAGELLDRIMEMADNAGATDEHRALNYLAVRYPGIYATAVEAFHRNHALRGIEVRPSRLSGVRNIVDVIFTFGDRSTDVVEKYYVRVDVTEAFPFLVTKITPYFDR
jgi:hypothetical protein